jgi:hypothetical protein
MESSEHKESLSSSFIDQLQNKRTESTTTQRRKRRKVHIPAGKSITAKNKFSKKGKQKKGSENESLIYREPEIESYEDEFLY